MAAKEDARNSRVHRGMSAAEWRESRDRASRNRSRGRKLRRVADLENWGTVPGQMALFEVPSDDNTGEGVQ